tara:strand:- start:1842 stop:2651 length:810 start_codon:yes stop_codon:yes gene_type:complete
MESSLPPDPAPPEPTPPAELPGSADNSLGAIFGRLGPAAALGVAWAVLPALGGFLVLFNMEPISTFLRGEAEAGPMREALGVATYVLIFIVSAGCGFLPTYSQAILAGYAFGVPVGFAAAWIGFGGASIVGFFIAGRFARERAEREIHRNVKARVVRDALIESGFWKALLIVTLVRIPPNSPFALMNLILCASGVKKRVYIIGTLVGMAPRTFAAVLIGSQITDWSNVEKPRWMIVGGIVLTFAVLGVIGAMANRALKRLTGPGTPAAD